MAVMRHFMEVAERAESSHLFYDEAGKVNCSERDGWRSWRWMDRGVILKVENSFLMTEV